MSDPEGEMPDQERHTKIILGYREMIEEAIELQDQNSPSAENILKISSVMDKAEQLVTKVRTADEAVLDAKVLNISSVILKQNAQSLDTNLTSFDMNVFANHVKQFVDAEQHSGPPVRNKWQKLSEIAKTCLHYQTPSYTPILGTFQIGEVVAPLQKVQRKREKLVEVKKKEPENVDKVEKEEEGIEETVHYILKTLASAWKKNNCKPICYFRLVVNPDSFGATVENIFYLSFLVKDGLVNIKLDNNDFPVVEPIPKSIAEQQRQSEAPEKNQILISISMKEWRDIIEVFGIKSAMIKPRKKPRESQTQ